MANSYIRLPEDGTGKKTRTISETVGSDEVHSQVVRNSNVAGTVINPSTEDTLTDVKNRLNAVKAYSLADYDDYTTTNVTYVGKMKSDGTWLFIKVDKTGNFKSFRYANISNNATKTTYALAYSDRTTLTYDYFNILTGV